MSGTFLIDKALNQPIEDLVAPYKIHQWYGRHQVKILGISKNTAVDNSREQQYYDLKDSLGRTWEVKTDKKFTTGNVFIEHEGLEHSKADYYLILAFHGYVIPRDKLIEVVASHRFKEVCGGDNKKMKGTLLPISELSKIAETI